MLLKTYRALIYIYIHYCGCKNTHTRDVLLFVQYDVRGANECRAIK